ncbi:Canalicular multispecific organic anion transporter 2 [Coemansia sp. RSA 455]|nr:Canalicular multispecific organic anion transporter 2 [Coemansia sp. RSA 455]
MAWQLLDTGTKALVVRLAYNFLNIRGAALILQGKQHPFTVEDIRDPVAEDEFCKQCKSICNDTTQRTTPISFMLMEWRTISYILVVDMVIQLAMHARRLIFVAALSAISRGGSGNNKHELATLLMVWQLLAVTVPAYEYITTLRAQSNRRIQALIYSKTQAVYVHSRGDSIGIWMIHVRVREFVDKFDDLISVFGTALAELLSVWVMASRIGWHALVPAAIVLVHTLLSQMVAKKIERLRRQSRMNKPPKFQENFGPMLRNIRTIKFYAWEDVFQNVLWHWAELKKYTPPMVWRALQFGLDLLGCATAEISAALAITSYISTDETIGYTDIALLMESIRSLTTFIATVATFGTTFERYKRSTRRLQRYIEPETTQYVERISATNDSAIELDECVFSWSTNSYSLAPITLQIKAGDFVTVVGRVGSGKSSFLSAICGEMPLTSGQGRIHGRIGYVEQKPWIMDATFRENVLMGADFDEAYFSGDLTTIGANGVNLSGGQKVRLALARALYMRADIYVLDDLLAAVDTLVERHIVERVLAADGIIGNKTRILVTHAEHLVPLSDTVITFVDGKMSVVRQNPLALSAVSIDAPDSKESVSSGESGTVSQEPGAADMYSKPLEYRKIASMWSAIWRFIQLSGYGTVAIVMTIQFTQTYALYYTESLRTKLMTDGDPATMVQSLKYYLVVNALVTIGRHQIKLFETWIRETVWTATLMAKMRKQVVDLILSMHLLILESLPSSAMSDLFYHSRWALAESIPCFVCQTMLHNVLSAVSATAQVVMSSPGLILLCGPLVALVYAVERWHGDTTAQFHRLHQEELERPQQHIKDILASNRELLRVHGITGIYLDKADRFNFMELKYRACISSIQGFLYLATALCTELIKTAVLSLGLWQQFYVSTPMSPGELDALTDLAVGFFNRTYAVAALKSLSESNIDHLSRYTAYMDGYQREQPRVIEGSRPLPTWPETGKIEFRHYSMRYRSDLDSALDDLTFVVHSKEKIGIVGRTGAGKSSLTYALMRLVEADSGSITIDGIDISTIGLYDLRSRISIIPQDPSLFVGTIRDNLDPTRQYTDDEVWAAINACNIADLLDTPTGKYTEKPVTADDDDDDESKGRWVEGTGLDKWVEYCGSNFSVGQRQLVSLCRALLWRRKILVLDEATANVDSETDRIMQSVIRQEFKDYTVLTIAHRLNTIMDSDRILVMDKGKVAEFDTPANLLARDGHFSKLVESMNLSKKQAQSL